MTAADRTRWLDRPDGRIGYRRAGSGPPVLLVQGAGVVGEGWRPQVEGLRQGFALVSFDNRGIGASTYRGPSLTIDAMAADALAIADAEGIERFHLAGHSMGGLIAQQIALTAPRRVLSLSFLCTFLRGREAARVTPAILLSALRMHVGTRAMRRRAFMRLVMPDAYLRQADLGRLVGELGELFGRDLADQPAIVMKQLRAMSRFDASERLRELDGIPTMVVSAALDRIALPQYGRSLAAAVPGAAYVEIPDAGHGVTIQCADRINMLLAAHFQTASNPAQSSGCRPLV
jgi:pimeloyl-ACP methyl ester carboxylesterase